MFHMIHCTKPTKTTKTSNLHQFLARDQKSQTSQAWVLDVKDHLPPNRQINQTTNIQDKRFGMGGGGIVCDMRNIG